MHFVQTEGEEGEVLSIKIVKLTYRLLTRTHAKKSYLISNPSLPLSVYLGRHWVTHMIKYTLIPHHTVSGEVESRKGQEQI